MRMAKRKMIQKNLVKNSIAAYFSAIEIHNKPNISYRYETVTLLMINAWELALKAFIKKNIKKVSIFTKVGHTITLGSSLTYTNDYLNTKKKNSFIAIKKNIEEIEKYRNNITHFYSEELEPYIFMLLARSALNYVEFIKLYFAKDIMADEGLFIMPLGFKLPFRPEEFLSDKVAKYASSDEAKDFINGIVTVIKDLNDKGIEDSIVLEFSVYLESVKKSTNSDILAGITTADNADITLSKNIRLTDDPSAPHMQYPDDNFRNMYPYSHKELVEWGKIHINNFKVSQKFHEIKTLISDDKKYVLLRQLDSNNKDSQKQKFYSTMALERIKEEYEKDDDTSGLFEKQ